MRATSFRFFFPQRFFGVLLSTLIVIVVAGVMAFWIAGRTPTLQWAIQKWLVSKDLQISGVSGSLYGPIHIDRISHRSPERTIVLDHVALRLVLSQLVRGQLMIDDVKVGQLTLTNLHSSTAPLKLPSDLVLPVQLAIHNGQLEKIIFLSPEGRVDINALYFSLNADGHQWALKHLSAVTPWGKLNGECLLSAHSPFAIDGSASLVADERLSPAAIKTTWHGTLSELTVAGISTLPTASGTGSLRLMPFEQQVLRAVDINLHGLSLTKWQDGLPSADADLTLSARIASEGNLSGALNILNQAPAGGLDQQRLPLHQLKLQLAGTINLPQMKDIVLDLGAAGKFNGVGSVQGALVTLNLHTDGINLKAIHSRLKATRIAGDIVLNAGAKIQTFHAALAEGRLRLNADATVADGLLQVRQARLQTGSSDVRLNGELNLIGVQSFKASGAIAHFNPSQFGSYPRADINADFRVNGQLADKWQVAADLNMLPSRVFNQALSGKGKLRVDAQHLRDVDIDLKLANNQLTVHGNFGALGDTLEWRIDAPRLQALGQEFNGVLNAKGTLAGSRQAPQLSFTVEGHDLTLFSTQHIKSLQSGGKLAEGTNGVLQADLAMTGVESAGVTLQSLHLTANGTRTAHVIQGTAHGDTIDAQAALRGGWMTNAANPQASGWAGSLTSLQNRGRIAFALASPAPLRLFGTQISLNNATFKLPDGSIQVKSLEKNANQLHSTGQVAGLPFNYLAQFSPQLSLAIRDKLETNLRFGATWAFDVGQHVDGTLRVYREDGDMTMRNDLAVTLGLTALEVRADIVKNAVHAQFDMQGTRLGHAHLDGKVRLTQRDGKWGLVATDPLLLNGTAQMTSIAWLSILSGQPGLQLDGTLALDFSANGTVGMPIFKGQLNGDQLAVRLTNEGLKLRNGQLRARLSDDQLILDQLHFEGDEGNANASGWWRYADSAASMQMKLVVDRLRVLARPDRLLVVSGQSNLTLDKKRLQLEGKFRAERALFELEDVDTPTMSSDVVIVGAPPKSAKAGASIPFYMDLTLDLGEQFTLKGKGLDAQIAGVVEIKSAESRVPRAIGNIHVVSGTYAAYGQRLQIERGVINFTGTLDNPGLNILALRKKSDAEAQEGSVEVGVEIRGTALAPSAKLVSTPSVPDSEKLSWLVFGHGTEGGAGSEVDLLGIAAGALFGAKSDALQSRVATSFGLDQVGLTRAKGLESTVLTIGKRISSKLYLTYEQGASSASTLVKLRYALNPRLSLQAQSGANNAVDLLYTWSFD